MRLLLSLALTAGAVFASNSWIRLESPPFEIYTDGGEKGARDVLRTIEQAHQVFRNFEFKLPLELLRAVQGSTVRLRFTVWRDHLPLDALPLEGWIQLRVAPEWELEGDIYNYSPSS